MKQLATAAGPPMSCFSGLGIGSRLCVYLFVFVLGGGATSQADDVLGASGFAPNRDYFSQLSYEHVDPLTGNLLLTFTDLVLPGNAGLDLRIQRTYNSKIYRNYETTGGTLGEDSWAGVGWTLHLGRVFHPYSSDPALPVIEMPDGSRQQAYRHIDGSGRFVTRDFWVYDRNTNTLKLTNGVVYTFARPVSISNVPGGTALYATRIADPFGNVIDIDYASGTGAPPDGIAKITQTVGSQTRQVTFTYNPTYRSLATMSFNGRTWSYTSVGAGTGYSLLTAASPPVGPGWTYGYNSTTYPLYELKSLTTPNGGTINYSYADNTFYLGSTTPVRQRVVTQRSVSGRGLSQGTWKYSYPSTGSQSTINGPCSTTTYSFLGVGNYSTVGAVWKIGLRVGRTLSDASGTPEAESLSWQPSLPISNDQESVGNNHDSAIYVALQASRIISRGSSNYSTSYGYSTTNFNDYGRPYAVSEVGEFARTTTRTFQYGFVPYIVDKIAWETVAVGQESFTRSYSYDLGTGFRSSQSIFGVPTTFGNDGRGNVRSVTDANNHTTTYSHSWGVVQDTTTPAYTITRTVNPDGTVASETRRGYTTYFAYDDLSRPTRRTPPVGNPTVTTYDNVNGASITMTRGSASLATTLDGFGRVTQTTNSVGVKTSTSYDVCGRKSYESYPYTTTNVGTSYQYDALDRVTRKTNTGDNTAVIYTYTGIDVDMTDENGNPTSQNWGAFGEPREARLAFLTDARNQVTAYSYNALGNLTKVVPPEGNVRSWTYNSKNQLVSEVHPESGTVGYTYYPAGNLSTRTDPQFGTTTYAYDGNDRLTSIVRPGGYNTTLAYDASDNRTYASGASVTSTFAYDGANRLIARTDSINGRSLTAGYAYDGNDNVTAITYPSQRTVTYAYDSANRITSVGSSVSAAAYAGSFGYHPSGAPASFTAGNGLVHGFGYDSRYRLASLDAGGVLRLGYNYDRGSNVTSISETSRSGMDQSFSYDGLDRLTVASGPWGSGSFAYNAIGDRLSSSVGGATTYGYDPATNRLTSAWGQTYQTYNYDPNGNVHSDGMGAYSYTPENMLSAARDVVLGRITSYGYDADNLRKLKTDNLGFNSYYAHGPGGQLLGEYVDGCAGGVRPIRDYIYAGTRLLAAAGPAAPTLRVASPGPVAEDAGQATVTVTLTTPDGCATASDVTVQYGTADGSAAAGSDYAALSGTLTFPKGSPSGGFKTLVVAVINDQLVETNETFFLSLSNPTSAELGTSTASLVILDNDTPVVSFLSTPTPSIGENGVWFTPPPTVVVVTNEGNALPGPVTVNYASSDGTATAGSDYSATSGTLTFAAGAPSGSLQSISVPVLEDSAVESDETLVLGLSSPTGATLGAATTKAVTILDDEPTLAFSAPSGLAAEGAGSAQAAVALTTRAGFPATTSYAASVSYATAPGTALAGIDYTTTTGTVSFPANTTSGTTQVISVPVVNDALDEDDETFTLSLANGAGARVGAPATSILTIQDDDLPPKIGIGHASVSEGAAGTTAGMNFAVFLSSPSGRAVTVEYATADGTAKAGSDYAAQSGTLTLAAGTTSVTLPITVTGDDADEEDEVFLVNLSNPVGAVLGGGGSQAQGTIRDDDGRSSLCSPILTAPFTISSSGNYCLAGNVSMSPTGGSAISIEADSVSVDLKGFTLDGTTGINAAYGISSSARSSISIRNGTIKGFLGGIGLMDQAPYKTARNNRIEGLLIDRNTNLGIWAAGSGTLIQGNRVNKTGGATCCAASPDGFGIVTFGPGVRMLRNDVTDVVAAGSGTAYSLQVNAGDGSVLGDNRIGNSPAGQSTGIAILGSSNVLTLKNRITGTGYGILYDAASSGRYRGNLTSGVDVPYTGGTDAGNNQ